MLVCGEAVPACLLLFSVLFPLAGWVIRALCFLVYFLWGLALVLVFSFRFFGFSPAFVCLFVTDWLFVVFCLKILAVR